MTFQSSIKKLTPKQKEVMRALSIPNARMNPPYDLPGKRTGYVTTNGSVSGWVCPVSLKTKEALNQLGLIKEVNGIFYSKND